MSPGETLKRLICFINPTSIAARRGTTRSWQKRIPFLVHYRKISMSPLFFCFFGQLLRDKSLSINYRQAAGGARSRFRWVDTAGHPPSCIPSEDFGLFFRDPSLCACLVHFHALLLNLLQFVFQFFKWHFGPPRLGSELLLCCTARRRIQIGSNYGETWMKRVLLKKLMTFGSLSGQAWNSP